MTAPTPPRYIVRFVSGDYGARQAEANRLNAALYLEGHANSSANTSADYALCVVATNASRASIALAQRLALAWGAAMDVGGDRDSDIGYGNGVRIGGAGDANLHHTDMPAVLCEPVFASNRTQALKAETTLGIATIAGILVDAIRDMIPAGSLIIFSIGHIGKLSAPKDRGAAWRGNRFGTEAEFAGAYLECAAQMLKQGLPTGNAHAPGATPTEARAFSQAHIIDARPLAEFTTNSDPRDAHVIAAETLATRLRALRSALVIPDPGTEREAQQLADGLAPLTGTPPELHIHIHHHSAPAA